MTKTKEIFYGIAGALILTGIVLIEGRPIWAIGAVAAGWIFIRLAERW